MEENKMGLDSKVKYYVALFVDFGGKKTFP